TDDQGSVDYNLSLSSERAEAVKLYLEQVGIVETRLNYFGYGETKPKQTNQTEKGRASNRRVEIIILKP
ncbi:MAG: OOP family OmpA-OmpF porin, partial [Flavobacteriales bacterium]